MQITDWRVLYYLDMSDFGKQPGLNTDSIWFEDLGRPVDANWLTNTTEAIREVTRGYFFELEMRNSPGILYIPGQAIKDAINAARLPRTTANTKQVVEELKLSKAIDRNFANRNIDVRVCGLDTDPVFEEPGVFQLRMRVGDLASSGAMGFAIRDEKQRTLLKISPHKAEVPQAQPRRRSRHRVTLGRVRTGSSRLEYDLHERLADALGPSVTFRPMGELTRKASTKE